MSKLTPSQTAILRALQEGALDVYDLSDEVRRNPRRVFDDCKVLRARQLVDWMYPEDQVLLIDKGRAALSRVARMGAQTAADAIRSRP